MTIITETTSSIFSVPPSSILIHACNAKGAWGSGVALDFKKRYPEAYETYTIHCKAPPLRTTLKEHQRGLVGTCLLIPPSSATPKTPQHYLACLFTSRDYGKRVDAPDTILINTTFALRDLESQIAVLKREKAWQGEVWAVRINSGRFGVPWERTKEVFEKGGLYITVVRPPEEVDENADGRELEGNGKPIEGNEVGVKGGSGKRKAVGEGGDGEGDRGETEEGNVTVKASLRKQRRKRGFGGSESVEIGEGS